MTKEEAKRKYKAGEIRICCNIDNIPLLEYIVNEKCKFDYGVCYSKLTPFDSTQLINLSEIIESEEEVVWIAKDMQVWNTERREWTDWMPSNHLAKYRLKPKPDYSTEIEALQEKAKENGMKAVITFEKL